ncbi:hypothetical protein [Nonomuraea sp. NPDC049309]|uniref:hypothetical protein n=1 Tax=Nonomuraea sp. NPDC049309 TaxID=3364350 RepID=UPI00371F68FE
MRSAIRTAGKRWVISSVTAPGGSSPPRALGRGVRRRGRLVQQHHQQPRRRTHRASGERQPLPLPAGEPHAALERLARLGLQAARKFSGHRAGVRAFQRRPDGREAVQGEPQVALHVRAFEPGERHGRDCGAHPVAQLPVDPPDHGGPAGSSSAVQSSWACSTSSRATSGPAPP